MGASIPGRPIWPLEKSPSSLSQPCGSEQLAGTVLLTLTLPRAPDSLRESVSWHPVSLELAETSAGFAESQLQVIPFLLRPRLFFSLSHIFAVCICLSNRTGGCSSHPETKKLYYTNRKQDGPRMFSAYEPLENVLELARPETGAKADPLFKRCP